VQTNPDAIRYMVSTSGSRTNNTVSSMRVFDHLSDALDHVRANYVEFFTDATGHRQPCVAYGTKIYELSPVKPPRLIKVTNKLLGLPT